MPDMVGVFLNRTVRREIAHVGDIMHRFHRPLFRMTIQLIHLILAIHIATVIRQHLIMVTKVDQRIQQIAIATRLRRAEQPGTDLRQRLMQLRILFVKFPRLIAVTT